ncbi:unannotated protein [freshwater metagenome]|jgi:hypothetical protein|uniref:Unannotated protein n=1 Tax=freshwater metagenome TaxID=449393 RepID=A0A6J7FXW7_9ZZZZ|nr:hypothetical protein [Acidimicrobiia bacterium]MCX6504301.1 hypothetical protein [Actinomycetota bacterium]GDX30689.1 hypothetical protein LBMAG14_11650 [Actinomycetes bacterium]MSO17990.1 hypothetical protein [Acidimicrobiia bacterium]MSV40496.1 hypothetical protein [Actinomycetota bacterium]
MSSSDQAELSTLRTQIDDLNERISALSSRYATSSAPVVADDLYSVERSLKAARRALDRAHAHISELA